MTQYPQRMSPWTAFFIGAFGLAAVTVCAVTTIALRGLSVADARVSDILGLATGTIDGLPELIEHLPRAVGDLLDDERRPDYAAEVSVTAKLVADDDGGRVRPVITIQNKGDRVVSLLAVRVAAMDADNNPRAEWTEVVATPLAIEDELRGPIMPGATRHVVGSSTWRWAGSRNVKGLTAAVEVSEVRVWNVSDAKLTAVTVAGQ